MAITLALNQTSVSPSLLQPHPRNVIIYGEDDDISELVEMISRSGWIKPLIITPNGTIISGHRRWLAAKQLNREIIPIEVKEFESEVEEIEFLLLENASRIKNIEQRVREGKIWSEIEQKKARERQKMAAITTNNKLGRNTDETLVANLPQASISQKRSREKVASRVGMKSRNYGKACQVVDFIDLLQEEGCLEKAKRLRRLLNQKSVDAAYRIIKVSSIEQDLMLGLNQSNTADTSNGDGKLKSQSKLELAHHLRLNYGVLVEIYKPDNPEIHQRLGRVAQVFEKTVDIWRRDMQTMVMKKYRVHHHQATIVNLEEHDNIARLEQRISNLRQKPLEPIDRDILDLIARAIALTPKEEQYLMMLERDYLEL